MPIEFWKKMGKIDVFRNEEKFLIQTCFQAKTSGAKLPEVHRVHIDQPSDVTVLQMEIYYASHNGVNFSHTSYHNRNIIL